MLLRGVGYQGDEADGRSHGDWAHGYMASRGSEKHGAYAHLGAAVFLQASWHRIASTLRGAKGHDSRQPHSPRYRLHRDLRHRHGGVQALL